MVTAFQKKVYAYLVNNVPRGKVTTYGAIARALKSSPRAVGQALRCNPYAPKVPCHRVVNANGSLGGFKGETEGRAILEKMQLLTKEGIKMQNGYVDESFIIHF